MDFLQRMELAQEVVAEKSEESFVLKSGTGKIMFSAPHAVEQTRNGKVKVSEPATGLLCEMLHNELGCPVIRKVSNRNDDANYDAVSDYRQALERYVRENSIELVIDLHQLAPHRNVMVCIGTGNYRNLSDKAILNKMLLTFSREKLGCLQIDNPFGGRFPYTVASSVHSNCKINAIQLELNSGFFMPAHREYNPEGVYKALRSAYYSISNYLGV